MNSIQRPAVAARTIQVWSDLLCPFAHVAIHRLWETRAKLGLEEVVGFDHHVFPLELFDGPHPRRGTDTEAVGLGQIAPEAGFRVWAQADDLYPHTVLLAAEAVLAAKAQSLRASELLDRALRVGFWLESKSISHRGAILEIASGLDLDRARLTEDLDNGTYRRAVMDDFAISQGEEVKGSPHLFLADGSSEHNPGITVHWEGPWAAGYPVVDSDQPEIFEDLLRRAAQG
ncbi:putative DsbA family dithiol-disulfide isomerase [Kribbella voronezhensis]|uniref:Putative DsbA family dithiol-disulfide isomerase n=1 Tax=Kribbella voronezhensis TaxID=2512212 RepID=A0A4R7T8X2_9ACTN|nr:DsbA family protein [Kribbella voronezhensis]TDU88109.1 putative DsbA family dithiol-disulfide isomerase [Kribbella voronezhensis]